MASSVPAEMALGPWDPGALHGGAPAALLAHVLWRAAPAQALRLARMTCEFVRPVPMAPLSIRVEVVRPGRRVTLLDAFISDPDGTVVTRARALLLGPSEMRRRPRRPPPFPGPEDGRAQRLRRSGPPMFATHAMEIRFVEGAFRHSARRRRGFGCASR